MFYHLDDKLILLKSTTYFLFKGEDEKVTRIRDSRLALHTSEKEKVVKFKQTRLNDLELPNCQTDFQNIIFRTDEVCLNFIYGMFVTRMKVYNT